MAKVIESILSQELDRREFLARVGATALTLLGIGGIIRAMTSSHSPVRTKGYGATPYGGDRKPGNTFSTASSTKAK
jgi:hypothetical protein